jgi:ATP-dependent RNA helicase RhlE
VCVDEAPLLRDIERLMKGPIAARVVPGFEPNRSIPAQPIRLRSGQRAQPQRSGPARPETGQRGRVRFGAGRRRRQQRKPSFSR